MEYAEIYKTIQQKAKKTSRNTTKISYKKRSWHHSLRKVSRLQKLGQDRLITLLDKQDREIHGQDKIIIKQGNTT